MSNPSNLITQVSREEAHTNPNYNPPSGYSSPGLLSLISDLCCCCFSTSSSKSTELYSQTSLTTAELYRKEAYGTANPEFDTPLLGPQPEKYKGKQTLVLDLDETLVHSSFKPIPNPDFVVPVEIDDHVHKVYVAKRPGVDQFLSTMGPIYEIVVFTASLSKYADPVLDLLDPDHHVTWRLFREHCTNFKGNFVKDLGRLGRQLNLVTIIDNSHTSYLFHPEHSIACTSWFDDETDRELYELVPFLRNMSIKSDVLPDLEDYRRRQGKHNSNNFY